MNKIRIGNSFTATFSVQTGGEVIDLNTVSNLVATVKCGAVIIPCTSSIQEDGSIKITVDGASQLCGGEYRLFVKFVYKSADIAYDADLCEIVLSTEQANINKLIDIPITGTITFVASGGGGGTSDYSELMNKPSINGVELNGNKTGTQLNLVTDANYVHTDNNYTTEEKTKLAGLENYVLPTDVVQDANYVHTDNNFTTEEKTKLAGLGGGGGVSTVSTLASVPITNPFVVADISTDEYLSFDGVLDNGQEILISVYNSGLSSITVTLPYGGIMMVDDSVVIPAGKYAEISTLQIGESLTGELITSYMYAVQP